jgi:hypothetical protein
MSDIQDLMVSKLCKAQVKGHPCGRPVASEGLTFCQEHILGAETHPLTKLKYADKLKTEELREVLKDYLSGDPKNVEEELALLRLALAIILDQAQANPLVRDPLARLVLAGKTCLQLPNGDRTFPLTVSEDEYKALTDMVEAQSTFFHPAVIGQMIVTIKAILSAVESMSKIKPEWVITHADMKKILMEMLDVIELSIPKDQVEIRRLVVGAIKRQCIDKLDKKGVGMEMAFGAQPIRGAKG